MPTLASVTSIGPKLRGLVWLLYPFVLLSRYLTRGLSHGPLLTGFNRDELMVMAEVSAKEGQLDQQETSILKNLLRLRRMRVMDVMTPTWHHYDKTKNRRILNTNHIGIQSIQKLRLVHAMIMIMITAR